MHRNFEVQKLIFLGFFRSGILGYGGGPSSIPLVHREVVERYKWMTDEEFSDVLAIGNTLPGPINTKISGYIGYKVGGILGLFNAITATVLPTVLLMVVLIGYISSIRDSSLVQGITQAIAPVVGVMLFTLAYSFIKQSEKGLGLSRTLIITFASIFCYQYLKLHPALLIFALLLYGFFSGNKIEKGKPQTLNNN